MPNYELTQVNSQKVVREIEGGTCVVLHRMNGCIHCELFRPVWKKVGDHYNNKNKDPVLVSVEYTSMGLLPKSMQNVQGFPTLRAYRNAKPIAEFNDVRTYDAVVDFVEKYGTKQKETKPKTPSKKQKK